MAQTHQAAAEAHETAARMWDTAYHAAAAAEARAAMARAIRASMALGLDMAAAEGEAGRHMAAAQMHRAAHAGA